MNTLREAVRRLEEEEHFEHIMLRGTQVVQQRPAPSGDLDAIMQDLMVTAPKPISSSQTQNVVDEADNFASTNPTTDVEMKDDMELKPAARAKRTTRKKEKRKAT